MTMHTDEASRAYEGATGNNPIFNLFAKNDGFWWPYHSFAKALLGAQKNTSAYLEANRKLMDEMRDIIRKEQDLALEISQKTLKELAETHLFPKGSVMPGASEVNAIFERATSGLRELGEAWMSAQMRSLDTMRSHASSGRKPAARPQHDSSAAA